MKSDLVFANFSLPLDPREIELDVKFSLPIRAKAKARPRFSTQGGRVTGHAYTDAATRSYEEEVAARSLAARPKFKLTGPLRVDIVAVYKRPGRDRDEEWRRLLKRVLGYLWRPRRPDVDNVRKAVMDALKGWWEDDGQVVDGRTLKVYGKPGDADRVWIRVRSTAMNDPSEQLRQVFGD